MKQVKKMVETTIYVADDGTKFDNEWDCMCYEAQDFFDSIHAIGEYGEKVYNYSDTLIFSIDSIEQITILKKYAFKYQVPISELENVMEKGIYIWDTKRKTYYKYPENF